MRVGGAATAGEEVASKPTPSNVADKDFWMDTGSLIQVIGSSFQNKLPAGYGMRSTKVPQFVERSASAAVRGYSLQKNISATAR